MTAAYAGTSSEPLFTALRQGDEARIQAAIRNGTDVNSRDAYGNTLLMQAAVYSSPALVEFLVADGADVNAANHAGHTALMRAMPDLAKIRLLVCCWRAARTRRQPQNSG